MEEVVVGEVTPRQSNDTPAIDSLTYAHMDDVQRLLLRQGRKGKEGVRKRRGRKMLILREVDKRK